MRSLLPRPSRQILNLSLTTKLLGRRLRLTQPLRRNKLRLTQMTLLRLRQRMRMWLRKRLWLRLRIWLWLRLRLLLLLRLGIMQRLITRNCFRLDPPLTLWKGQDKRMRLWEGLLIRLNKRLLLRKRKRKKQRLRQKLRQRLRMMLRLKESLGKRSIGVAN